jgi:Ca-activated chloride channel homolog
MSSRAVITALVLAASSTALAAPEREDRTESPYFYVQSDDPSADRLPLKETSAEVEIAGVIAHVKVKQLYQNEGSRPLEAIYVFPGSTRAAVFGMRMKVGERTIVAKIDRKDAARRTYEQAKREGKSASLLEQHRPNVFQMNVANILPGDRIEVELDYTELLVPERGVYELVYPTVVGPRYTGKTSTEKGPENWSANPYLAKGVPPPYKFGLKATIRAGMGIHSLSSPSHRVSPRFSGPSTASIELDEPDGGNRDFVLRYRLGGDGIETGLLLLPGSDESFFLLMVQPPKQLEPSYIPPREYIFVLDVSGSMGGFPLDTTKSLMRELFRNLRTEDRFNVLMFSGGSTVLAEESLPATQSNLQKAITAIDGMRGGGGTEILGAIRKALSLPRAEGMSTSIVVATDGYVVVEKETFDEIARGLGTANLFAFGIGTSVNRYLIEGMARAGMGEPYFVLSPDHAEDQATKLRRAIESPVLTDIAVRYEGFEAYDVEPPAIPDVFSEKPVVVFGKYKGSPRGKIVVEGKSGRGKYSVALEANAARAEEKNGALRYLWARHKITRISDFARIGAATKAEEEITALGLKYSLMTEHTSFVAVDDVVRNHDKSSTTVNVPLPLPQGVPQAAVGQAPMGGSGYGAGGGGMGLRRASAKSAAPRSPPPAPSAPAELSIGDSAGVGGLGSVGHGAGVASGRSGGGLDKPKEAEVKDERATRAEISGENLSAQQIASVRKQLSAVRACYEKALKRSPLGALTIRFEIKVGSDGKVKSVRLLSQSKDAEFEGCLQRILSQARFAASGSEVTIELPIHFRP